MLTAVRTTALLAAALTVVGCAAQADGPGASAPSAADVPGDVVLPAGDALVLQVADGPLSASARTNTGRLPLVSVYADGRVITEGPTIAVHPGPAAPNLQVATIPADRVQELVASALDAGVGQAVEWGLPDVEGVPVTTFTVVTAEGARTSEVHGFRETAGDGEDGGLTEAQLAARVPLHDLVDDLLATAGPATEPYVPQSVAALVDRAYEPEARPDDVSTWPGPPLPGALLSSASEVSCVIASGEDAFAALEAAAGASTATVWQNPDGGRWAVSLRPLLPHEDGCADLPRP